MTIQDAIALFDQGQYEKAFESFAAIYNESENSQERQDIMSMLQEAYYEPNVAELQENYEKNIAALSNYPYFWDKHFISFSDLSFLLFPISDESYYLYDKQADRFVGEYDGVTRHKMRYFFQDLERALTVEDEDNLYNLTFLFDNVRRSEDVAMDNHIYLLYNSWQPLQRVLQVGDITPLLKHEKFVFLIEKQNHSRYPINFKDEFGIDYDTVIYQPVRIDEIDRICYWYKHAYSGTALSRGILMASMHTSVFGAHDLHTYSTINGKNATIVLAEWLKQPYKIINLTALKKHVMRADVTIKLPDLSEFIEWMIHLDAEKVEYSVLQIFKGYFLFHYQKKNIKSRIVPVIVFDPHIWKCNIYNQLLHEFKYCITLTCMRNPIMVFGRCYQYGMIGWDKFQTQYILASDYAHAQFLSEKLLEQYWGYRFEDLKTKPEETVRGICRLLNIPFEQKMLEVEVPMTDKAGNTVRGFDQAPLHHNLSQVLSEFDHMRLKIFYDPILKYYGYERFPSKLHPMSEKLVRELFDVCFCFEAYNHKIYPQSPESAEFHQWIQEILQNFWKKKITVPKLIELENTAHE